jgi:virginiamycin B lyase
LKARRVITLLATFSMLLLSFSTFVPTHSTSRSNVEGIASPLLLDPDQPSPIINYPIPTPNSVPDAIIAGPNDTFWFTEFGAGKIGEFNAKTDTVTNEYTIPNETGAEPATIAIDKQGIIWFTDENQFLPSILSLNTTGGVFHRYLTSSTPSLPFFVLVDPTTNDVWFTDSTGDYLGEISNATQAQYNHINNYYIINNGITKYSLPSDAEPYEMVKDNGTSYFWITESLSETTGRILRFETTTDATQEYAPTVPLSYPVGIVVDRNGDVWASEHGGSSVTEFIPSNSTWRKYPTSQGLTGPTGVATLAIDSQGRLWFAEHYANRIGRLDPSTGQMDEFTLPIPGAYSLLDAVDATGNFWFTEANANEIGMIRENASSPVSIRIIKAPSATVTAGSSAGAEFNIINNDLTNPVTVSLNVTSSFTTNYYTTKSEISLSNYTLSLGPGESENVTAVLTPDFSLSSGLYAAGITVNYGNVSSVMSTFLRVGGNSLYQLETLLPEILIAAAIAILLVFLFFRKRKSGSTAGNATLAPTIAPAASLVILFLFLIQEIGLAWGKCPGLPPPPGGSSGPDPYGIALDVGSIAFFAVVAYLLIRSRLRGQSWAQGNDQTQQPESGSDK